MSVLVSISLLPFVLIIEPLGCRTERLDRLIHVRPGPVPIV